MNTNYINKFQREIDEGDKIEWKNYVVGSNNSEAAPSLVTPHSSALTQIEQKEIYEFLTSRDKPFFVDTFRKLLNEFDKEEISMSKFVEVLNVTAYKWHKSKLNSDKNDEPH